MALRESSKVFRFELFDVPLIHLSVRDQARLNKGTYIDDSN